MSSRPEPRISAAEAARAAVAAVDDGGAIAIVAAVDAPERMAPDLLGRRMLVTPDGDARGTFGDAALDDRAVELALRALERAVPETAEVEVDGETCTLYAEAQRAPDELVVVGAGHIAVPLAQLGVMLGFRTTVLDDREDFATPERFPERARVVRADFSNPFRDVPVGPRTYLVLVTRAHKYDFDCLKDLVERDVLPAYIGMIGSRRRVKAAFRGLFDAGIPRDRLDRVYAPVGLDVGAETPEEIAVSIAAEMVQLRRGAGSSDATSLARKERVLGRLLPETEPAAPGGTTDG